MKKSQILLAFFIAILLAATLATGLLSGCQGKTIKIEQIEEVILKGPPEIKDAVICTGIDENYEPVNPTSVFPSGTGSVFLSVKFKNFTTADNIKVVWSYLDIDKELSTQEYTPEADGSGNHFFNIKNSAGFQSGKYSAEIYFNGKLFEELEYTVE